MGLIGHGRGDDAVAQLNMEERARVYEERQQAALLEHPALRQIVQAVVEARARLEGADRTEATAAIDKALTRHRTARTLITDLGELRIEPARIVGVCIGDDDDSE